MRTSNPALNDNVFRSVIRTSGDETMTVGGTVNKTAILLGIALCTAYFTWQLFYGGDSSMMFPAIMVGGIGGFILGLVTVFKQAWSPITAPFYAAFEGILLAAFSSYLELRYPGIVMQAVALTFATLFSLLLAYKVGLLKATETFRRTIVIATGAIAVVYMLNFVMGFFHASIPFLNDASPIGIAVSGVIVVVAALNLILDFDFIERGSAQGAPKYMEWYGAFGLMVTLVWLYLEILRLLSKLRRR